MEIIISALISAASAIAVCLIGNSVRHKKTMDELNKKDILQAYKIELLEKQVDKQSQIIDRVFLLERDRDLTAEKMNVANIRLETLEKLYKK